MHCIQMHFSRISSFKMFKHFPSPITHWQENVQLGHRFSQTEISRLHLQIENYTLIEKVKLKVISVYKNDLSTYRVFIF